MRVIIPRNKTPRRESSRERQLRNAHEQKMMEKQAATIDIHDTLHSIFWGKPNREQLRPMWERHGKELVSSRVDGMKSEIIELGGKA